MNKELINDQSSSWRSFLLLHLVVFFYSLAGVSAKFASSMSFFSIPWCLFYGAILIILFFYAIAWQVVLRRMALTVAFCNKSVSVIWGIVWGAFLFNEVISKKQMLGAIVIIIGVCMVVVGNRTHE